ncbi:MAG: hypothetical protein Q7U14_14245, partial [Lacisediminimonas sp.]|nr:hypothetical protein [Lacisediminimonas sp.]
VLILDDWPPACVPIFRRSLMARRPPGARFNHQPVAGGALAPLDWGGDDRRRQKPSTTLRVSLNESTK